MLGHLRRTPRVRLATSIIFIVLAACGIFATGQPGGERRIQGVSLRSTAATATVVDSPDAPDIACPRCEGLFSRLEDKALLDSKLGQDVLIQLRGEPKVWEEGVDKFQSSRLCSLCWVHR